MSMRDRNVRVSARELYVRAAQTEAGVRAGVLRGWRGAAAAGALVLAASGALGEPEGARVVRGDVSIQRNGSETLIRASRNSIINYRSFDIAGHESVRFIQPDASSRVLNRIQSASPTRIDGSLTANGRVYIVNPAGVVFGQGSVVNVNGLFAAAGNISDESFLRGQDRFTLSGSVVNEGTITGSFVGLLGRHASNVGSIVAPNGAVVMAAGQDVYVGEHGGNVYVKVSGAAEAPAGKAGADNSGTIDARGGRAVIAAGDMYSLAVRSGGSVKARSVRVEGQGAGTVEVGGTIDARGQATEGPRARVGRAASRDGAAGGTVEVLGERVALRGATIDASGPAGGGRVNIGGGFQGRGDLRTAERTFVSADSTIRADATARGNGGEVVVWSDAATNYEGTISVKGGPGGGDAGRIEVSGKETLRFAGWVDATAPAGKAGSVLLDPRDITIADAGADSVPGNDEFLENPSTDVTFDADLLTAILDAGTPLTLQANRDIAVNEAIVVSNGGGDGGALTFQAGRSITIGADIITDNGALGLFANDANANAADRGAGEGGIFVADNVTIDVGGGAFTATVRPDVGGFEAGDITFGNSTTLLAGAASLETPGSITTGSGVATMNVGVYQATAGESITSGHVIGSPVTVVLRADGDVTVSEDLTASGISLHAGRTGTGTLSFGAAGVDLSADTIILRAGDSTGGANTATVDAVTNAPVFRAQAGGATSPVSFFLRQDAAVADGAIPDASQFAGGVAGVAYNLRSDDDTVTITTASKVDGSSLLVTGIGGVTLGTDLAVANLNVAGDATLGGNIDAGGGFVIFNNALDLGSADRSIIGGAMLFAGLVESSGGGLTLDNSGLLTVSGGVDLTGAGGFLQSGSGGVTLASAVRTEGQTIRFNSAVTLGASAPDSTVEIDTTSAGDVAAGGLIRFDSTIDAQNLGGQGLSLRAGTDGNILLAGHVGGLSRLADFTIQNAANVSTLSVRALNVTQVTGSQTTQFDGLLDAAGNVSLTGNAFGLTQGAQSQGSFTVNNAGVLTLGGGITTSGGLVAITGPVTLAADVTIDTTGGGSAPAGADIALAGLVEADATVNNRALVFMAGGGGSVVLGGDAGLLRPLASVTATGEDIFLHAVQTLGAQTYNGRTTLGGNLRSLTGGAIDVNGPAFVAADLTVETAGLSGSDDIIFREGLDATVAGVDLTLVAGLGDVRLLGDSGDLRRLNSLSVSARTAELQRVETAGSQAYAATTSLAGDISGSSVTFSGAVELRADVTVTGTTSVDFNGEIDSQAGEEVALTVLSPNGSFGGDIGGSNILASLTTDAGGLTIGAGLIHVAGEITFGDALTLASHLTVRSDSGGVSFLGAVNSDTTTRSLVVNSGGDQNTVFAAGGGATRALRSVETNADGATLIGGDIITTQHQFYRDAVVLIDDVTLSGNSVSFFSTINSAAAQPARALTVSGGTGGITASGAIGGDDPLASLTMSATQITLSSASTRGFQTFNGLTSTFGDLRVLGPGGITINGDFRPRAAATTLRTLGQSATDAITITGSINNRLGSHAITLAAGAGGVEISGPVGLQDLSGDFRPASLSVSGATVNVGTVRTIGSQLYSGAVTLRGDLSTTGTGSIAVSGSTRLGANLTVTTTSGPVVFGGALDSDNTAARTLTILTGGGGATRFVGAVGATNPLASLFTNADGTTRIEGGSIRATGDLQFDDPVTLANATTLSGNDVIFSASLNSDGVGTPRALVVNTTTAGSDIGETTFAGRVGGLTPLRSITTNADGVTRIGASVNTTAGMDFGDGVQIVSDLTLDAGNGAFVFRSTIDSDASNADRALVLLSNAASDVHQGVSPAFRFGGSIGNTTRLGSVTLGSDRPDPQWAATAVFSDSFDSSGRVLRSGVANTDQFTINTGAGGFTMGANQKITAFGTLRITSTGTVTLGDITALTNIEVTSPDIRIRRRPAGEVQDNVFQSPDVRPRDVGVDFVASGFINFSRTPTLVGSGPPPTFSTDSGTADAELIGFAFRRYPDGIRTDLFADPRAGNGNFLLALDLRSQGPTLTNTATSLAGALPSADNPSVIDQTVPSAEILAQLAEVGISTRGMSFEQLVEALAGRAMYSDLPLRSRPSAQAGDFRVSAARLSAPAVRDVIAAYRALVLVPVLDEEGRPVLGEDGKPVATDRTAFIKQVLTGAWSRYVQAASEPTGVGFRAHLERLGPAAMPEDAQALAFLNATRRVFDRLDDLGLSPYETAIPKRRLSNDIRPAAMTDGEFRAAVYGEPGSLAMMP